MRIMSDMIMVSSAWIICFEIRFSGLFEISKGIPSSILYFKLVPFICVIWLIVLATSGFYKRTGHHRSPFIEALDIFQSCILATLGFIAFTYIYEEYRYSRLTMLIFGVVHPFMIIFGRSIIRKALRSYRRRSPAKRNLVIGSGDSFNHALSMDDMGDLTRGEFVGVILVGDEESIASSRDFANKKGVHIFETPKSWTTFFSTSRIESVVFALPYQSYDFLDKHMDEIATQVADIKLLPDILRFTRFSAGVDIINGIPVINIHESPLAGIGSILKRLIDVAGSLVGLVVFGPIMALLTILIPLTSRGPILYKQERMGLDGRTFKVFKFRSMPTNAEQKSGAVWAQKGDDRSTWVGNIIRKSSLDETPQLFNILMGDMSLVGPRPERPVFVDEFRQSVPGYYLRHKVKAGLTGWAQVNGWRGNTSIQKRIEYDLFYIQNWSVWFDFRIIFLTAFKGFLNKNAY
jgi:Undecaprenyl-phosphate glucose phosphotransferase